MPQRLLRQHAAADLNRHVHARDWLISGIRRCRTLSAGQIYHRMQHPGAPRRRNPANGVGIVTVSRRRARSRLSVETHHGAASIKSNAGIIITSP